MQAMMKILGDDALGSVGEILRATLGASRFKIIIII
jgi:hypothetical protein